VCCEFLCRLFCFISLELPLNDTFVPKMFCGPEIENLSPKLDERRQRINFDKRFEWSFPPPGQSTNLKDVGRPDWEGYSSSIERRRKVEVCLTFSSNNYHSNHICRTKIPTTNLSSYGRMLAINYIDCVRGRK